MRGDCGLSAHEACDADDGHLRHWSIHGVVARCLDLQGSGEVSLPFAKCEDVLVSTSVGECRKAGSDAGGMLQVSTLLGDADGTARYVSLCFPSADVGYRRQCHPAHLELGGESSLGLVLRATLDAAFSRMPDCPPDEARDLVAAIAGTLRMVLATCRGLECRRAAPSATRRDEICQFIIDNSRQDGISADTLCQRFGLSRATLYRLFKEEGGLMNFIAKVRMDQIVVQLRATPREHGAVSRIAREWNYYDTPNFYRLFKRHTGMVPGRILGADLVPEGVMDGVKVRSYG